MSDAALGKPRRSGPVAALCGRARHSVRAASYLSKACRGLPALPTRWRTVVRTINPAPILEFLAQASANRVHANVAGFLFQLMVIAQAVIEKIALPIHTMFSSDELFPVLHDRLHSRFTRERKNGMQMIRHEQA